MSIQTNEIKAPSAMVILPCPTCGRSVKVLGEEGTKESFGPFLGYPTKYLIDRDGRVVKRYFGMVGSELTADVEKLIQTGSLDEPSPSAS